MSQYADNEYLFTSESVTEGHPDKVADQISDGVLDAVLRDDPYGRVACETLVNTGLVVVSGEISTKTYVDVPRIVRETVDRIGYNDASFGFDCNTCAVISAIDALRARMNELGATYDLVTQLTQSTELERFKADRKLSAAKALEGNERQRRQVARDIDNVRAVADAARDFLLLMRDTTDSLGQARSHLSENAAEPFRTSHREAA